MKGSGITFSFLRMASRINAHHNVTTSQSLYAIGKKCSISGYHKTRLSRTPQSFIHIRYTSNEGKNRSIQATIRNYFSRIKSEKAKAMLYRIPLGFACYNFFPVHFVSPIGPSMQPTIAPRGDILMIDNLLFRIGFHLDLCESLREGDIILARKPLMKDNDWNSSKKENGLETQAEEKRESSAFEIQQRVIKRIKYIGNMEIDLEKDCDEDLPAFEGHIPKGHLWIEGDNPEMSTDSRHYGPIKSEDVEGKIIMRVWPLDKFELFHK